MRAASVEHSAGSGWLLWVKLGSEPLRIDYGRGRFERASGTIWAQAEGRPDGNDTIADIALAGPELGARRL